jgi:hypothetical protein
VEIHFFPVTRLRISGSIPPFTLTPSRRGKDNFNVLLHAANYQLHANALLLSDNRLDGLSDMYDQNYVYKTSKKIGI